MKVSMTAGYRSANRNLLHSFISVEELHGWQAGSEVRTPAWWLDLDSWITQWKEWMIPESCPPTLTWTHISHIYAHCINTYNIHITHIYTCTYTYSIYPYHINTCAYTYILHKHTWHTYHPHASYVDISHTYNISYTHTMQTHITCIIHKSYTHITYTSPYHTYTLFIHHTHTIQTHADIHHAYIYIQCIQIIHISHTHTHYT